MKRWDDWIKFTQYIADGHKVAGQNRAKRCRSG